MNKTKKCTKNNKKSSQKIENELKVVLHVEKIITQAVVTMFEFVSGGSGRIDAGLCAYACVHERTS